MKFGLFNCNSGPWVRPDFAKRLARHAEALGYESLWGGEHAVVPAIRTPPLLLDPQTPLLDPLIALAYLASATERIGLATGVLVLPQRNPVLLAKELASLDVLSGGRLIVGIGAGYLEAEFRAMGASFEERGERADEYIRVMRTLWQSPEPAFDGRWFTFHDVDAYPRPTRASGPPIYVGGHSTAALRRAVRFGQGWFGMFLTAEEAAVAIRRLRSLAQEVERFVDTPEVSVTITPKGRLSQERVEAYRALGVDRLVLFPSVFLSFDETLAYLEENAPARFNV